MKQSDCMFENPRARFATVDPQVLGTVVRQAKQVAVTEAGFLFVCLLYALCRGIRAFMCIYIINIYICNFIQEGSK